MKCPHCLVGIHEHFRDLPLQEWDGRHWSANIMQCPECDKVIIRLLAIQAKPRRVETILAYPKSVSRGPVPREVPAPYANDYKEACLVFADSEKASAALSRRCLQAILRNVAKTKAHDLSKQIDEVIASSALPAHLAQAIDAIRNIGNFAAHLQKDTNTGAILDVEPGEAEWCLEVLEGLFDFYFVKPTQLAAKKKTLNDKLLAAGKPPMK